MEAYLLDWGNVLLRWLHVIAAMAWIGASFYFILLDSSLEVPTSDELKKKGVDGHLWAVHGGGFYHSQKYMVAPKSGIDTKLHWSMWESYMTWISGFSLFFVLYLLNANTYLIDKTVFNWTSPLAAGVVAVGFLVGFWIAYDVICRVFGFRDKLITFLLVVLVTVSAWLSSQLFAGRAAFLITGAMMATAMSANVFFWIIPGQRKVVKTMMSGEPYDPESLAIYGKWGKQRSVHNTYFTLPVIIAMISNHYSFLYNHAHHWLVLLLIMFAGALIRQYFVLRHPYHLGKCSYPWPYAAGGIALLLVVIAWLAPTPSSGSQVAAVASEPVDYATLQPVLEERCYICHGDTVQMKGLRFDDQEIVEKNAQDIYQQVVVTKNMPQNNATQMTDEERAMVARWFEDR